MALFRKLLLTKQEASINMLLKGVENALVPNSALSAIQIRSDSDVPYDRVGFVWRAIQHHLGKTKKDAEAEWKKMWTNSLRAVYDPIRKDIGLWGKTIASQYNAMA